MFRSRDHSSLVGDNPTGEISEVKVGGDLCLQSPVMASGEIILDGQALISQGLTVTRGGWTVVWSPNHSYVLARIDLDAQQRIYDIAMAGSEIILPVIQDNVPMLSDDQALQIRSALDQRSPALQVTKAAHAADARVAGYPSDELLELRDHRFDLVVASSPTLRSLLRAVLADCDVTPREFFAQWRRILRFDEHRHQPALIAWAEQQRLLYSQVEDDLVWDSTAHVGDMPGQPSVHFSEPVVIHYYSQPVYEGVGDLSDSDDDTSEQFASFAVSLEPSGATHTAFVVHTLCTLNPHWLSHTPADPNCDICIKAKRQAAKFRRGCAMSPDDSRTIDGPLIVGDWCGPFTLSTDKCKYAAVFGEVSTGAIYVKASPTMEAPTSEEILHEARIAWGIEQTPFVFHSDCASVFRTPSLRSYLASQGAQPVLGVPFDSNTNARAERFVRTMVDFTKTHLYQARLPGRFWPLAAEHGMNEYSRSINLPPRVNTTEPVPFGTLGFAKISRNLLPRPKEAPNLVPVMCAGIDRYSSAGMRIMYVARNGLLRRSVIRHSNVIWHVGHYAFQQSPVNLQQITRIDRKMLMGMPLDTAIECRTCGKWRHVMRTVAEEYPDDVPFECADIGLDCQYPEDPEVWQGLDTVNDLAPLPGVDMDPELPDRDSLARRFAPGQGPRDRADPGLHLQDLAPAPNPNNGDANPYPALLDLEVEDDLGDLGDPPPPGAGVPQGLAAQVHVVASQVPELALTSCGDQDGSLGMTPYPRHSNEQSQWNGQPPDWPALVSATSEPSTADVTPTMSHQVFRAVAQTHDEHVQDARRVAQSTQAFAAIHAVARTAMSDDTRSRLINKVGSERTNTYADGLIRMFVTKRTQINWGNALTVARQECKSDKEGESRAFAVVVANGKAMAPDNPQKGEWEKAIDSEVSGLVPGVLKPVPVDSVAPEDELLPAMLILTRKHEGRFKARIVACGNYQQVQPTDCYSSVVSHDVWLPTVVAGLAMNKQVWQIDISQAFLQTDVADYKPGDKRTFLRIPKYVPGHGSGTVWQVIRSVYGLRSAPRDWQKTLGKALRAIGFVPHSLDDSVYHDRKGNCVLLYVDDLVVVADPQVAKSLLDAVRSRFETTDPVALHEASQEDPMVFLSHEMWVESSSLGQRLVISQRW